LPSEPYVKVSLHTAQAFTNAPRGTRPSPPPCPDYAPVGDSSGAPAPDYTAGRPPRTHATTSDAPANPFPGSAVPHRRATGPVVVAKVVAFPCGPPRSSASAERHALQNTAPTTCRTGSRPRGSSYAGGWASALLPPGIPDGALLRLVPGPR